MTIVTMQCVVIVVFLLGAFVVVWQLRGFIVVLVCLRSVVNMSNKMKSSA